MNSPDYDPMYYTLSTIAQVLAAFIGLSGVFVFSRIQEMKKILINYFKMIYEIIDRYKEPKKIFENLETFKNYIRTKNLKSIIDSVKEISLAILQNFKTDKTGWENISFDEVLPYLRNQLIDYVELYYRNHFFYETEKRRSLLIRYTTLSVSIGVSTILVSLILLPTFKMIDPLYYWAIYTVVLLGAISSMVVMVMIIFEIIYENNILHKLNHIFIKIFRIFKLKKRAKKEIKNIDDKKDTAESI